MVCNSCKIVRKTTRNQNFSTKISKNVNCSKSLLRKVNYNKKTSRNVIKTSQER